ncbi:sulfatase-like hydrolase/transferase, partial [candidate division CSSED10-310 bacterium]
LTAHEPFALPDERYSYFSAEFPDARFRNALRYSDISLRRFFNLASQSRYFNNTLFVILGDHTIGRGIHNSRDLYHVPCLFYAPNHLSPTRLDNVASQIDILPSILDLLNTSTLHASFGSSLFASQRSGRALFSRGEIVGILDENRLLESDYEKSIAFYNYRADPQLNYNLLPQENEQAVCLRQDLLAYLQSTFFLLRTNRLYPSEYWFSDRNVP